MEDTTTEWYYIDKGGAQQGPVLQRDIKTQWDAGNVNGECIAWNANLEGWTKIQELATLMEYLS